MSYEEFEEEVKVLGNLKSTLQVLTWDEEVMMPENGAEPRSKQKSTVSRIQHEKLVSDRFGELIKSVDEDELSDDQRANLREVKRERKRMLKVPSELIQKISQKESECVNAWKEAKAEDNFESFAEELEELVELKREYANTINSKKDPYQVLFEDYEPYLSFERMEEILEELKQELVPLIDRIKSEGQSINKDAFEGDFNEEEIKEINDDLLDYLGFDRSECRLDVSEHPFTSGNSFDTRITTWLIEDDISESIMPTIHECGHAFYNLGVPEEHYGTPRGESRELSIHESQSRLWENQVGRSKEFWKFMLPKLKEKFPSEFKDTNVKDCFESVNQVYEDNLIRVEADELTYHLHIIIRFEIGKALINGEIEVEDLPEIWNSKMKEYLGIEPETDSEGVMQDIHWAWGNFGYFPTYTLGSVIATQFYNEAEKDIESLEEEIEEGNFEELREWLEENIHSKGKLLETEELVKDITGEKPSAEPFLNYVKEKYSSLYEI